MNGGRHQSQLTGDEDDTETREIEDVENTVRRIQEVSRGNHTWNSIASAIESTMCQRDRTPE